MNIISRGVTVAALVLATTQLSAQNVQVERYTLPNGLRVVLNEDHSTPLVAINIWYHVGSKNERPGRTGFAHLFEHMLFSGSQHVAKNEHFGYVQSVGGIINGSTNFDRTNYYETVPSNYLPLVLWLESDRMGWFLPALDQEKLDIQKQVVKEERRQRYDNVPYGTWIENLLQRLFPEGHPYRHPTIGYMPDLTAAELEDVREFFRTWYTPNNAVLTLVGDFDRQQARELIERYFGPIPRGPEPQRVQIAPVQLQTEQRGVVEGSVQLPRVYRAYHIPAFGQPDWIAADLLSGILTGGKASRLERSLVLEQQIAQDVNSFAWPAESTGIFIISATPKPGIEVAAVERALDAEIQRLVQNGPTADELQRVKNRSEADLANQLGRFSSRADVLSMMETFFGDANEVNRMPARYDAVTADQVRSVASRYLVAANRVAVEFVPRQANTPASGGSSEGGR